MFLWHAVIKARRCKRGSEFSACHPFLACHLLAILLLLAICRLLLARSERLPLKSRHAAAATAATERRSRCVVAAHSENLNARLGGAIGATEDPLCAGCHRWRRSAAAALQGAGRRGSLEALASQPGHAGSPRDTCRVRGTKNHQASHLPAGPVESSAAPSMAWRGTPCVGSCCGVVPAPLPLPAGLQAFAGPCCPEVLRPPPPHPLVRQPHACCCCSVLFSCCCRVPRFPSAPPSLRVSHYGQIDPIVGQSGSWARSQAAER